MEIIRCNKGHFYDSEEFRACPYCDGSHAGQNRSLEGILATDYFGHSTPATSPVSPTAPAGNGPRPTEKADEQPKVQKYGPTVPSNNVQIPGKTVAVNHGTIVQTQAQANLVGWLVCVEGPARGKDYQIRNQNNYIGRNSGSDICIPEDTSISADRSANIVYDDQNRVFFFGPSAGKNAVRVNGGMVVNSVQLQAYDVLQVGVSKLLFVPLCGDRFDWNE